MQNKFTYNHGKVKNEAKILHVGHGSDFVGHLNAVGLESVEGFPFSKKSQWDKDGG